MDDVLGRNGSGSSTHWRDCPGIGVSNVGEDSYLDRSTSAFDIHFVGVADLAGRSDVFTTRGAWKGPGLKSSVGIDFEFWVAVANFSLASIIGFSDFLA